MTDVRVLVVDDQEPFRRAMAAVVEETDGFVVVGAVASGVTTDGVTVAPCVKLPETVAVGTGVEVGGGPKVGMSSKRTTYTSPATWGFLG